jgi:glycosyltransferase involved in cell wall biosynthesis
MPEISAIMALYNTPYEYLKPTVESILAQTFKDFELIIIDDASNIEYEIFFNRFEDERIKYFKLEKNAGPGHARNEGIKKAIGKYIAIVDSDDIYMPQRFEVQKKFLDKNNEIALISNAFKQSNNGKIPSVIEKDEDIKITMLFNSPLANPCVMLRKNMFIDNNLFYPEDKTFAEDYELWINAMFKKIKMANLNDVLMIYTRRKNQLSKSNAEKQISILKDLYKKIFSQLEIDFSQEEIDLHYNIYSQNFKSISIKKVSDWLDKIIEANKKINFLQENKLLSLKENTLKIITNQKNRILKIKIGKNNLCVYKPLKISLEQRS